MSAALLIDFGSTWTKLRALDLDSGALLATAQGPSTVASDVNIGLDVALASLSKALGGLPKFVCRLAASSAAGGLRMATIGLVRELTAEAARQAALGAGAKLCGAFAYRLTVADLGEVERLAPDIVLLCGGTDGGNRDVILHNAHALARSALRCPVVVAGNRETTDEIVALLSEGGRMVLAAANVLPAIDTLDIEPARAAIRDVFMRRIVSAKGIDRASARVDRVLMPTPAAVLEGARLLADGVAGREGLGALVVVDPGGATTDVHSIGAGEPAEPGVIRHGLPEPYAKRTVEGDLGVRHNAAAIVAAVGLDAIAARAGIAPQEAATALTRLEANVEMLPTTDAELQLDDALARAAVDIAMARHAGTVETVYTAQGPVQVQRGKDLSAVGWLIGTGGAIVHARDPASILAAACAQTPGSLRPRAPRLAVDADYLLYAAGLLAQVDPVAAFDCARRHLRLVQGPDPMDDPNAAARRP
ncbi:MAG TPA: methylaspartate mutase accessory protein GlmL [Casimicrobiaceae bacterium]